MIPRDEVTPPQESLPEFRNVTNEPRNDLDDYRLQEKPPETWSGSGKVIDSDVVEEYRLRARSLRAPDQIGVFTTDEGAPGVYAERLVEAARVLETGATEYEIATRVQTGVISRLLMLHAEKAALLIMPRQHGPTDDLHVRACREFADRVSYPRRVRCTVGVRER
jgi:hypothetical protein